MTLWRLFNTELQYNSSFHPQTDVQIEAVNKTMGNIIRYFIGDMLKQWDQYLAPAELGYSYNVNISTGTSVLEIVYRSSNHQDSRFTLAAEYLAERIQKIQ